MKFCEVCGSSSLDGIKFVRKSILFKYFGINEICLGCEPGLKEKMIEAKNYKGVSLHSINSSLTPRRNSD